MDKLTREQFDNAIEDIEGSTLSIDDIVEFVKLYVTNGSEVESRINHDIELFVKNKVVEYLESIVE